MTIADDPSMEHAELNEALVLEKELVELQLKIGQRKRLLNQAKQDWLINKCGWYWKEFSVNSNMALTFICKDFDGVEVSVDLEKAYLIERGLHQDVALKLMEGIK